VETIKWHGTAEDGRELVAAIGKNCTCVIHKGVTRERCELHTLLVTSQRFVDDLLFIRSLRQQLIKEEFE
jgi:hypothetical protein